MRNILHGFAGNVWLPAVMALSVALPAYAYIDPGTGSYLFQLLLGMVLGSLMAIKIYWRRIKDTVARWMGRKPVE